MNWCDVETAIANVFGINLPEDGIDDEGAMISDYAVSFGSLQDYLYLANEANALNASDYIDSRVDEIERLRERFDTIKSSNSKLKLALQTYLRNNDVRRVHTDLHDYSICQNGGKLPVKITADVCDIPSEYCIYAPKPDMDAIRKALLDGKDLEFAHLDTRGEHIRIK